MGKAGPAQTIISVLGRMFRLLCCAAIIVGTMMAAAGDLNAESALAPPRAYEISAQPLDTALNAYIRASGVQVLYETALTTGRRSMAVKGNFTPDVALNVLLSGTGLRARRTDIDAFVITAPPSGQTGSSVEAVRPDGQFMAALQVGVLDALCRTSRTRPGEYKVAIELWIASTGVVQRSALVGSTGEADRDDAILSALRGVSIRVPPPSTLPQPLILSIGQRAPKETGDCAG
jgi:hypothetical protein